MMTSLQLLFLLTMFQVSNGNVVEKRLELLEKQMKEVLEREAHTKRENEEQNKALYDMKTVVEELQATVASQQSIIVELRATVSEQSDRIAALESERFDTEQGGAFQDSTPMHDAPKSDVINGGKYARSGISRRQPPEMMVAFSAVKVAIQSSIGLNQNIIFENVILNQGNGFHSQHGVFIAPQTGIYVIVASLLHDGHTPVAYAAIIHDGNIVAKMHGYQWEQFSQTVIIAVNAGDEIYIRNIAHDHEAISGDSFSTFSGFLLWQL